VIVSAPALRWENGDRGGVKRNGVYWRQSPGGNPRLTRTNSRNSGRKLQPIEVVWDREFGRTVYCQGKLTADDFGRYWHGPNTVYSRVPGGVAKSPYPDRGRRESGMATDRQVGPRLRF